MQKNKSLLTYCTFILDDICQEIIKGVKLFPSDNEDLIEEEEEEDFNKKEKK